MTPNCVTEEALEVPRPSGSPLCLFVGLSAYRAEPRTYHFTMSNRQGEPAKTYFRAGGRSLLSDGSWYFATREGIDVGPYPSRQAAEAGSARLAKLLRGNTDPVAVQKIIREFMFLMAKSNIRMP